MKPMAQSTTVKKLLASITLGLCMILALTASTCDTTTEIVPFQKEICTDKIDNNGDGLIDCDDRECTALISCQKTTTPVDTAHKVLISDTTKATK